MPIFAQLALGLSSLRLDIVRSDARKQPTRTGGEAASAAQPNERAAAPIGVRPAT